MSKLQLRSQLRRSIRSHYVWKKEETWKFLQGLSPTVQKGKQLEGEQTHQAVAGKVFSASTEACLLCRVLDCSSSESLPVLEWAFLVINLLWSYSCSLLSISSLKFLLVTTITILFIYKVGLLCSCYCAGGRVEEEVEEEGKEREEEEQGRKSYRISINDLKTSQQGPLPNGFTISS